MTKVINFFGGPGCSKSTSAAELFAAMKWNNMSVELVSEYAKQVTWEGHHNILNDQLYLLAKQNRKLERLRGQVRYIITDSPLILGIHYATDEYLPNSFTPMVLELFNSYENINILLKRLKPFHAVGRSQTEDQAKAVDTDLKNLLEDLGLHYTLVDGCRGNSEKILDIIKSHEL